LGGPNCINPILIALFICGVDINNNLDRF